jgi:hypothetical protein
MSSVEIKEKKNNTSNEIRVIRRNLVERSILQNKIEMIEREKVYYWKGLMEATIETKHFLEATKVSTGSAFENLPQLTANSSKSSLNENIGKIV